MPAWRYDVGDTAAIAHQAAGRGELAPLVDSWHRMANRQRGELFAPVGEERIGCRSTSAPACSSSKVAKTASKSRSLLRIQNMEPAVRGRAPPSAGLVICDLCIAVGRVDENGDDPRRRHQLVQQLQPLRRKLHLQDGRAGDVAARTGEAGD